MKPFNLLTLLLLASSLSWAQSELMFPWVTNNSQFRGVIIVNNLNNASIEVTLTARRNNGDSATATRTIEAFGQLVEGSETLFGSMGEGAGFAVQLTSSADNITAAFVIRGTFSASGSSPAQANVASPSDASNIIIFSYLPVPPEGGDSAPVVVNMGASTADVTFHGYQNGQKVGTFSVMVEPLRPYANVTSAMFAGASGDFYVVAESDLPLLGMAFIFNSETEPSMSNAVAIDAVPDPDMNTGTTVSFSMDVQPIFDASCALSSCHIGSSPQAGLNLSAAQAYGELVNVPSVQSSLDLVEPFDPQNSYLYLKIDDDPSNNSMLRMPRSRPPLPDEEIEIIEAWIAEGALNN